MTTVREHLEAIMRIAEQAPDSDHRACDIYTEAIEALKLLKAADHGWYDEEDGSVRLSEGGLPGEILVRVIPDQPS